MNTNQVYLHYLDRELHNSVGSNIGPDLIADITAITLLMTNSCLNCSLSTLFETCSPHEGLFKTMMQLVSMNKVNLLSHHPSVAEFFHSRKKIYAHDKKRYPMYFEEKDNFLSESKDISIFFKNSSTTKELKKNLGNLAIHNDELIYRKITVDNKKNKIDLSSVILNGLDNIKENAITWTAFSNYSKAENSEYLLRRSISFFYTSHYLDFIKGDIVTGINNINYYDNLSKDFPFLDYQVLKKIACFFLPKTLGNNFFNDSFFIKIFFVENTHKLQFFLKIRILIRIIFIKNDCYNKNYNYIRSIFNADLDVFFTNVKFNMPDNERYWFVEVVHVIDKVIDDFSKESGYNSDVVNQAKIMESGKLKKILICITTDLEMEVMFDYFKKEGCEISTSYSDNIVIFNIENRCDVDLFAVKTQMGSGGVGGSAFTVEEAIRKINPDSVIALGIAFGIKEGKQKIGDILVSRQVQFYELQRIGKDKIIPRGDKISASPHLLSRCDAAKIYWEKSKIHTGLILSGDKLVDSSKFKKKLLKKEPEAIGGEMEGAGLIAACLRHNKDWLVIKGICDWGEGKEDKDQELACFNAFDLFSHILKDGGWS